MTIFYINFQIVKVFYFLSILIDDFSGDMIEENEEFPKTDAAYIKKMLMKVNKSNGAINPIDLPRMRYIFMKYKMNMLDAEDLCTKYFGGWGGEANNSSDYALALVTVKDDSITVKHVFLDSSLDYEDIYNLER